MPPIEPFSQGDLDGLCSIYALINAVRVLFPKLEPAAAHDLFRHLVRCLEDRPLPLGTVCDGLGERELQQLARECRDYVADEFGCVFHTGHLPIERRISVQSIWTGLQRELDGSSAAIIGLAGREQHWTVGYAATGRTVRLVDSSDMSLLVRARCTVNTTIGRYQLDPAAIIVLRRGKRPRRKAAW